MNIDKVLLQKQEKISSFICIIGLVILLLNTLLENKPPIFDEIFYIQEVEIINKLGISIKFLHSSQVAVGPVTAIIHYLLQPITHLQIPYIRLVNFILLIFTITTTIKTLNLLGYKNPTSHVLGMIAVPMIWPVSGMLLTEVPAMFFLSLSLYIFILAFYGDFSPKWEFLNQKYPFKIILSLLSGLLFSFSILTRQTFLLCLLAFPILLFKESQKRKYIYSFLFTALLLPITIFIIWGGIVPPLHLARQGYISNETFSIINGFSSFAYAGIILVIIAPRCFLIGKKISLITIFGSSVIFIINTFYDFIKIIPAYSIAIKIFPGSSIIIYSKLCSGILAVFSFVFIMVLVKMILENKNDLIYIFLCISLFLICATPFKIVHLFSSRYTATALPLMMLVTARYNSHDKWESLRLCLGIISGFFILRSFFNAH